MDTYILFGDINILICNILPWRVPSDTSLLQSLSFPELLLCIMFDALVTARSQR